jgi:predicted NBD/HSP70 family sugar kinase
VVAEKSGLPVSIDNDSSLIALAELRFGGARERKNAMVINIGWGVGLGIVVNGTLFRGHNGFAGEFSHIPLFSNGKMCSCGKTGCLETETSLQILVQKARAGLTNGRISQLKAEALDHYESASESMIEAAREGDRYTMELISEAAYHIGRGVSILIHLMNPELVILSGRGAAAGKVWLPAMQQAINEHSIPRIAADTAIELSGLGYQAELIGAAALVMEHFGEDAPEKTNRSEATASLHI